MENVEINATSYIEGERLTGNQNEELRKKISW